VVGGASTREPVEMGVGGRGREDENVKPFRVFKRELKEVNV